MTKCYLSLLLLIFSFSAAAETQILEVNFDGALPPGVVAKPPEAEDAISIVPNGKNGSAAKIKVMNSLDYISDADKIRAEYSTIGEKATLYREGDERSYQFSFKLDRSWVFDSRDSVDIIFQFKRTEGQPDMFVAVKGHDLVLRIAENRQMLIQKDIKADIWNDVKLHIKFSKTDKGHIESHFNNQNQNEDSGPNMRDRDGATYLKWGIYKPDNFKNSTLTKSQAHIVYIDEISVTKP
ncbi:MAG: heparin lyase I family protein [Pseudobdellovibrio sp.]